MAKRNPKKLAEQDAEATGEARQELQALRDARASKKRALEKDRHNRKLLDELERVEQMLEIALDMREDASEYRPITIKTREKGVGREGTVVGLFSDIHPEEVIKPETVNGLNEFNPEIARERVHTMIEGYRWYLETIRARNNKAGYNIRDFILVLGGDLISNTIHPDLSESVALLPADACVFVFDLIQTVIDALLQDKHLERIVVPCLLGNHDRMTPKIRHQTKAGTSLATIIYHMLRKMYAGEDRLVWDIARSNMTYTEVYGKLIRSTHGDDMRYGGGVGGIHIPLRKKLDRWNQTRHAAITNVHHFHTAMTGSDYVVNGSVIGYTGFSQAIGAGLEPPAQMMYTIDPDRGKRFSFPVVLQDLPDHWS